MGRRGARAALLAVWLGVTAAVAAEPPTRVVCFVRDNGRGIERRYHDKIFGPIDSPKARA